MFLFVASPCGNICQTNEESNVSRTHIEETAIALMFVLVNLMKQHFMKNRFKVSLCGIIRWHVYVALLNVQWFGIITLFSPGIFHQRPILLTLLSVVGVGANNYSGEQHDESDRNSETPKVTSVRKSL